MPDDATADGSGDPSDGGDAGSGRPDVANDHAGSDRPDVANDDAGSDRPDVANDDAGDGDAHGHNGDANGDAGQESPAQGDAGEPVTDAESTTGESPNQASSNRASEARGSGDREPPDQESIADTPHGRDRSGETSDGPPSETQPDGPQEPPDTDKAPEAEGSSAADEAPDVEESTAGDESAAENPSADDVPPDVQQYARFKKVDGSRYERVNEFLRDRTYITAREWAIARLCADFRTETGVEMTKIGENLPELVPFMTDTYTPQAVNQARASFEEKVRMAGATFLYGAMCDFFTAEELDDMIYEVTEVAKFLLEVEGVDLAVEDELETEDRISEVMREVRTASEALRNGDLECPECGHELASGDSE